jgi:hypothetical protein
MMQAYEVVIQENVLDLLISLAKGERLDIAGFLRQIAADPKKTPEFIETYAYPRPLQIQYFRRWRIAYWVDEFARELRIVDLRRMR